MKEISFLLLSRREWLNVAGTLGLGAAGSTIAITMPAAVEKHGLTHHQVLAAAPRSPRHGMGFELDLTPTSHSVIGLKSRSSGNRARFPASETGKA